MAATTALGTKPLGRHGLHVSSLAFGAMGMTTFYTSAFAAAEAEGRADALFDAALAAGCNTVVTARLYESSTGGPHNEELVGRQLKRHGREKWIVVTKIGVDLKRTPPFAQSPDELRAELAVSA